MRRRVYNARRRPGSIRRRGSSRRGGFNKSFKRRLRRSPGRVGYRI